MSTNIDRLNSTPGLKSRKLSKEQFDATLYRALVLISEGYSSSLSIRRATTELGTPYTSAVLTAIRKDKRFLKSTEKIFEAAKTPKRGEPVTKSRVMAAQELNDKIHWEQRAAWVLSELEKGVLYHELRQVNRWANLTNFRSNLPKRHPLLERLEATLPRRAKKPANDLSQEEGLKLVHDLVVKQGYSTSYVRSIVPHVWLILKIARGEPMEVEIRNKIKQKSIKDARSSIVSAYLKTL